MKRQDPDEGMTGRDRSGLRATDDRDPLLTPGTDHEPVRGGDAGIRTPVRLEPRESGNGALWALCGALTLALLGFGYWSHQQQAQLQQQLVATQNSFARISEEAAGRIQDITGKVSATESSLSVAEETRQTRLETMQEQLTALAERVDAQDSETRAAAEAGDDIAAGLATQRANQQTLTTQTGELAELIAAQASRISAAEAQAAENATQLQSLAGDVSGLTGSLARLDQLEARLVTQTQAAATLKQRVDELAQAGSGADLERALLILRTEMEERQKYTQEALQSIDAFRAQVNGAIVTLREQIANLQQQLAGS